MADELDFIGQEFKAVPQKTTTVVLRILSDFPTIANAGVKVFKDNGNDTITQVGQGALIDTSINTPQGDSAVLALDGTGNYVVAFQGQATSVNGDGVSVSFELSLNGGPPLEDFGGARTSTGVTALLNGAAYVTLPKVPAPVGVAA